MEKDKYLGTLTKYKNIPIIDAEHMNNRSEAAHIPGSADALYLQICYNQIAKTDMEGFYETE